MGMRSGAIEVHTGARETPGLWGHGWGPRGCAPGGVGMCTPQCPLETVAPAANGRLQPAQWDPVLGLKKRGQSPRGRHTSPLPSAVTDRRMCQEGQNRPTPSAAAPGSSPTAQPRSRPSLLHACPWASALLCGQFGQVSRCPAPPPSLYVCTKDVILPGLWTVLRIKSQPV